MTNKLTTPRITAILTAAFFICLQEMGLAVPFTGMRNVTQPDGTQIELYTEGDEFYAHYEHDGHAVVFSQETQSYVYATLSADGSELLPTRLRAGMDDPAVLGLPRHQRITGESRREKTRARREAWGVEERRRHQQQDAPMLLNAFGDEEGGPSVAPPARGTTGLIVGLTLLVDFPDFPSRISVNEIRQFLNGDNYTGYGNNGSVKKYFSDVSKGMLTYTNIVVGYVRAPQPRAHYESGGKDNCGPNAQRLIRDVLGKLTNQTDYASTILPSLDALSRNSSGYVFALNILYTSNGAYTGWPDGLWPHRWWVSPISIGNGIRLSDYQITNLGNECRLGTFCHENGHLICGFPDLYIESDILKLQSAWFGLACCLMGNGAHADDGRNPVAVCGYLATAAGWGTATILPWGIDNEAINLKLYNLSPLNVLRYQNPNRPGEYFIIENRLRTGRDTGMNREGTLLWHVNEQGNNFKYPNTPLECWVEVALGNGQLCEPAWIDGTSSGLSMLPGTRQSDHIPLSFGIFARREVIYVDASRPNDNGSGISWATAKKTIQAAVNYALPGSTVLVTNGVYGPISVNKKITIQSVNGAAATIIDGGNNSRCAYLGGAKRNGATLIGFTLRNGRFQTNGTGGGGGVSGGMVYNCIITGNTAIGNRRTGGGADDSILYNCLLIGNTANQTTVGFGGYAFGGGANNCVLYNCTLAGNTATLMGGQCAGGVSDSTLYNCIVWGNTAPNNANYDNRCTFYNSCTTPSPGGTGNITQNPLFVSSSSGNYRLQASSPCVNKGNNAHAFGHFDLDGRPRIINGTVDMGAYEFAPSYTVIFNGNGGTPTSQNVTQTFGNNYVLPTFNPTHTEEYTFVGWFTELTGGSQVTATTTVMQTSAHTLYAHWNIPPTHTFTTPIPVPYVWLNDYRPWKGVTDYEVLGNLLGENDLFFWESYVAGLNPTDANSKFLITNLVVSAGSRVSRLDWTPYRTDRTYTVWGKTNLTDTTPWYTPTNSGTRFFRVKVEMK